MSTPLPAPAGDTEPGPTRPLAPPVPPPPPGWSSAPAPVGPQPHAEMRARGPVRADGPGGRTLASAVAVFLGGYLILLSLGSTLVANLAGAGGYGPATMVLQLSQLVFAVLVVVLGLALAPSPGWRRLVGSALVALAVVVILVVQVTRVQRPFGGVGLLMTLGNTPFLVLASVGAAWLLVRRSSLGWIGLLGTLVLVPVPYLLSSSGLEWALTQMVTLALAAVVGLVILAAGRPLSREG